ncbi:ArsR/SmtB family transcription factor [Streptomyces uncialis]|uniref:ArsR family transcriptional regulator n=1 Tax=Streptomyces uncialis TaxID=1048205 RepID=A0A1Q4UXW5_9ACTN|nr:winged helix-turn-helix domain-containing protein [Streptomyces uncialis]OKH90349.1 ArsR family transcriptional regulator [Streptomyces uncialis]
MGWWHVDADTLAASRFTLSPLSETVAAVMSLERGEPAHPGDQHWLNLHRPAYRERLAADPTTAQLIRAALGRFWLADYLTPTPTGDLTPTDDATPVLETELSLVRSTPPAMARAHLTRSLAGPLPALLDRSDLPERTADLLHWVWTETVLPTWPRRRRILEADVIARLQHLTRGGWAAALDGMRPGVRWLGEGRLQVNVDEYPPRDLTGTQLFLVPVTPQHGWVSWNARTHAITYPCTGALTLAPRHPTPVPASLPSPHSPFHSPSRRPGPPARDTRPAPPHPVTPPLAPEALTRLLGPVRATVLTLLDTPKSTTHLVALTGQALGTIGRHLKILHDAHLVERRRAGRSVLYYRTPTAEALLSAQHPPTQHPPTQR